MNVLYAQVVGSILAAGLLGLACGWWLQRGQAARRQRATISVWEDKLKKIKALAAENARGLEDRLQEVGEELRTLTRQKRDLSAALAERDAHQGQTRTDAIEANREQAAVIERLQRRLAKRERQLGELAAGSRRTAAPTADPTTARHADDGETVEAYIDRFADRHPREAPARRAPPAKGTAVVASIAAGQVEADRDVGGPDTAMEAEAPSFDESFEATALIDIGAEEADELGIDPTALVPIDDLDATDPDLPAFEDDEATVAFDDATLARLRRSARD